MSPDSTNSDKNANKSDLVRTPLKAYKTNPSAYLDYKEFLQAFYAAVKADISDYTYLRFAFDLGFSATGVIHQVIKGRRTLTAKAGKKIIEAMALRGYERQYFEHLITYCNAHSGDEKSACFKALVEIRSKIDPSLVTPDQLEFVSEWFHPVIKELISIPHISQDPAVMAKLLFPPIRPLQVKYSLELLTRLGFIAYDEETARYITAREDFKTPRSAEGLLVARYHQAMIDLARSAVSEIEHDSRDISSTTFRVSTAMITQIKEQIYQFQMKMLEQEESSDTTENIYQLNIQLFPLTKLGSQKDK